MKLTSKALRQIIREEAQRLSEASPYMVNSPMTGKPRRYDRGDGNSYDFPAQHIDKAVADAKRSFPGLLGSHLSDPDVLDAVEQELARSIDSVRGAGGGPNVDAWDVLSAVERILSNR